MAAPDGLYVVQMAATGSKHPGDVEQAKRDTHDLVIEHAGDRRRSGVQWLIFDTVDAFAVVERVMAEDTALVRWSTQEPNAAKAIAVGAQLAEREDLLAFMREHPHGQLIVAICEVVP